MDWMIENAQLLWNVLTIALVAAVFLYVRYFRDQERLRQDLARVLQEGLAFLKGWAGDELEKVTQEDVNGVANEFYLRFILDTPVERLVTPEQFRALFWAGFCKWRDSFIQINYAMTLDKIPF